MDSSPAPPAQLKETVLFTFINDRLMSMVQSVQVRRLEAEEDGQTLVEYGLILGLLAIAAIAAMTVLGGSINGMFTDAAGALGGGTTTTT